MKKLKEIVLAGIAALGISACCNTPEHSISLERIADGYRSEEENQEIGIQIAQNRLEQLATYENVEPLVGFLNDFSVHLLRITDNSWIAEEFAYALNHVQLTIALNEEEYRSFEPPFQPNNGEPYPGFFQGCCDTAVFTSQLSLFSLISNLPHELGHGMDEFNDRPLSERFSTAMELYTLFRFFAYDQTLGGRRIMGWGQAPFSELPDDKYSLNRVHAAYHFATNGSWEEAMEAIAYERTSEHQEHFRQIKEGFSRELYRIIAYAVVNNPAFENALSREGLTDEEIAWIREYLYGNISFVDAENTGTFCNSIEAEVDWQIPFIQLRDKFQQIYCP